MGGGGGALATSPPPQYLHTYSYKETPVTRNNTQQHTRTPNIRQQHTTTVHNSTQIHKITNVPQFLKQRDINSYYAFNVGYYYSSSHGMHCSCYERISYTTTFVPGFFCLFFGRLAFRDPIFSSFSVRQAVGHLRLRIPKTKQYTVFQFIFVLSKLAVVTRISRPFFSLSFTEV